MIGRPPWRLLTVPLVVTLAVSAGVVVPLRWCRPPTSAMMIAVRRRRRADGEPDELDVTWVDIEHISREMWLAAVAAEDGRFRHHRGFDWVSIRSAIAHNRSGGAKRGASTISQQVSKNLFLWPGRSWVRKLLEAYLTVWIEVAWPKRRILEVYLNVAQFGPNVFGVEAAARRSFGVAARELTQEQAARLAATLPTPERLATEDESFEMWFRQLRVLDAMSRVGDSYLEHLR